MKKINWFNLKAGKEIRVQTLIQAGFNLEADFFSLNSSKNWYFVRVHESRWVQIRFPPGAFSLALLLV